MHTLSSLVLCGGAARRMQGRDKPLALWAKDTLVSHILRTLPEGPVLISANRSLAEYRALGFPVIEDGDHQGPLAGIAAAALFIDKATTKGEQQSDSERYLYVVAGDTPKLPANLARQLLACCTANNAVAACAEAERLHPLPLLVRLDALQTLPDYLAEGRRSVLGWLRTLNHATLSLADQEALFVNINTPEELERLNTFS